MTANYGGGSLSVFYINRHNKLSHEGSFV
ncbi:MAG: hypothetical protein ACK55Z_15420 [bacterium]